MYKYRVKALKDQLYHTDVYCIMFNSGQLYLV